MSAAPPQQIDKEEAEREIKALSDEYNTHAEKLNDAELKLNAIKDKSFQLLRQLYKQRKFSDPSTHAALADLEKQYDASEVDISGAQNSHYEVMQECFRLLQKLRLLQTNYLVAIINSLQKEISDSKPGSAAGPAAPAQGSGPQKPVVREDNLV